MLISYTRKKKFVSGDCAYQESLNLVILRGDTFFIADWLQKLKIQYFLYIPDGLHGENDDFLLDAYKNFVYKDICENAQAIILTNSLAVSEFKKFRIRNFYFLNPYHEFNDPFRELNNRENLRIIFAGSIYTRQTFNIFITALSEFIDETDVKVDFYIYTSWKPTFSLKVLNANLSIIIKPLVSLSYLKNEVRRSDLCYLPYSFLSKDKKRMICGFPSKASLYFNSSVPVFVHAPSYSSISHFCRIHGYDLVSNSLEVIEVVAKLREWWFTGSRRIPANISDEFSKRLFYDTLENTIH